MFCKQCGNKIDGRELTVISFRKHIQEIVIWEMLFTAMTVNQHTRLFLVIMELISGGRE